MLISLPYFPDGFALPNLVPLIDRALYPADRYPDGQWDYYRFYLTHFEQAVGDMDADVTATLATLFRPGDPASAGRISPSATVTANGGRYGAARRAPRRRRISHSGPWPISTRWWMRSGPAGSARPTPGI